MIQIQKGDKIIYQMVEGQMKKVADVSAEAAARPNFVIVCQYGDWSGFRTLAECERQFAELEGYHHASGARRIYGVVER